MRQFRRSILALLLLWSGPSFGAQSDVEIQQKAIECWPVDEFLLVQSKFVPPGDIQTAKFYFRSTAHPDYYYVELTLGPSGGSAIVPKAEPNTPGVSFYLELVTRSFSAFRTEEREIPVASGSECKRRDPEAAYYTGQNPDIAVGATRLGATPLPPGFQADGIARFLSATGISGETAAGGVSGKTIGIIAGIGGAGAAALALSGGGSSETTTTAIGGITTSSVTSSSTSTAIGGVTTTTTTTGGGSSTSSTTTTVVGGPTTTVIGSSTTTVIGSSTTTVIGSSTTTVIGSSTTTTGGPTTTTIGSSTTTSVGTSSSTTSIGTSTTTSVGSSTTTTSVGSTSSSTTTSVASSTTTSIASSSSTTTSTGGNNADISVTKSGPASAVVNTMFTYTISVTNLGPATATSVGLQDNLPNGMTAQQVDAPCSLGSSVICSLPNLASGATRNVNIRVLATQVGTFTNSAFAAAAQNDPNFSNNTGTRRTTISPTLRTGVEPAEPGTFVSTLELAGRSDGSARGRVIVDSSTAYDVQSGVPHVHRIPATSDSIRVEGVLSPVEEDGTWSFDFSSSRGFLAGSIASESGRVLSLTSQRVVFSIGPGAPRVQFTFYRADDDRSRR